MNELQRKTVFLYPSLMTLRPEELALTNNLITSMNFIVESTNQLIHSILTGGNFSFIDYLPSVLLKCVNDDVSSFSDCKDVRICIIGFNKIDYRGNYNKVIKEFKSGASDISHLVAIHIMDNENNPTFLYDEKGDFDVLIRTSIDHIGKVLASILLDISLYHYFSLSSDLAKRKNFNTQKFNYLKSKLSDIEQKNIYGQTLKERSIYLSLSLKNINKLSMRDRESRKKTIDELIKDFENFVLSGLSCEVQCNSRGSIIHPDEHRETILNYSDVQDYIRHHVDTTKYYIIVPGNSTKKASIYMIKYDHDIDLIREWVAVVANMSEYQIIKVVTVMEEA